MVTIILAAGYGTRLYPLTLDKPKALLLVGGKTILDRIVEKATLIKENNKIFIVTNDKFHKAFEEWARTKFHPRGGKLSTPGVVEVEVINDETKSNETRLGAIGDINFVLEKGSIRSIEQQALGNFDVTLKKVELDQQIVRLFYSEIDNNTASPVRSRLRTI